MFLIGELDSGGAGGGPAPQHVTGDQQREESGTGRTLTRAPHVGP